MLPTTAKTQSASYSITQSFVLPRQSAVQNNANIGICGHAPSDYPEFARFLVEQGIDSISLNPDSVLQTMLKIADVEAV